MNQSLSVAEAMLANLFWGFGFTATIWALEAFSIIQILIIRFLTVGLIGLSWALLGKRQALIRKFLPLTFLPGLFLIIEFLFQVWGMNFTTATNAGFLTITYVLMVPILEQFYLKTKVRSSHWGWVLLGLLGTSFMAQLHTYQFNLGDLLILISALGASLHLLSVHKIGQTDKSLFFANTMQSLWSGLLLLPYLIFQNEPWTAPHDYKAWIGIASLTFGSTMLALYLQMRAQRKLSPSVSSLLFLVESPISAAFGFALLNETITLVQAFGCFLILISSAGVIWQNLSNCPIEKNTTPAKPADSPDLV